MIVIRQAWDASRFASIQPTITTKNSTFASIYSASQENEKSIRILNQPYLSLLYS